MGRAYTTMAEFNLLDATGVVIPRTGWTVVADSQETQGENGAATNAIDGSTTTFWHTQWQAASPPPPHTFTVNLGTARTVGGFKYLPRQNLSVGRIAGWRFLTSPDGTNWTVVAQGTFTNDAAERTVADSQETQGENGAATNAIDGSTTTFWHTQWQAASPPPPHTFTVNLGTARTVGGFKYLPRQNLSVGRIAGWRFLTSPDGTNWTVVAQGTFTNDAAERTVTFAPP
ncbi:discoidin domain-containing protein [Methylibium sp. Root1272]|uniref:discoidin domain-containing protein n=1 Tax=Methylibium sp. Root1272 TaxID=1736441 RepID=UPI003857C27A